MALTTKFEEKAHSGREYYGSKNKYNIEIETDSELSKEHYAKLLQAIADIRDVMSLYVVLDYSSPTYGGGGGGSNGKGGGGGNKTTT